MTDENMALFFALVQGLELPEWKGFRKNDDRAPGEGNIYRKLPYKIVVGLCCES